MTETTYSIISYNAKDLPKEYEALLFSKWLRSLRKGNPLYRSVEAIKYFDEYHRFIENLLKKPDMLIKLAVLTDDHDVVLGFSCSREDVLDYLYVQPDQRGQKISTALIPEYIRTFSHMTKLWMPIWQAKYKHWRFNPKA